MMANLKAFFTSAKKAMDIYGAARITISESLLSSCGNNKEKN